MTLACAASGRREGSVALGRRDRGGVRRGARIIRTMDVIGQNEKRWYQRHVAQLWPYSIARDPARMYAKPQEWGSAGTAVTAR